MVAVIYQFSKDIPPNRRNQKYMVGRPLAWQKKRRFLEFGKVADCQNKSLRLKTYSYSRATEHGKYLQTACKHLLNVHIC